MIVGFANKETERIWNRERSKKLPSDIQSRAVAKLAMVHAADDINDLRIPPGNRLEALSGNRFGQHSIRINDQWRICFRFKDGNAHEVEICDYH